MKPNDHPHQPLRAGALTLLIAVVLLCLSVVAVLSLSTARSDLAMSNRQLELVRTQAAAELLGQQWLAEADGGTPPAGTQNHDGTLTADLPVDDTHTLQVALRVADWQITRWQLTTTWAPDDTETLWPGPAAE